MRMILSNSERMNQQQQSCLGRVQMIGNGTYFLCIPASAKRNGFIGCVIIMAFGTNQQIKIIHTAEEEIAFDSNSPRVTMQGKFVRPYKAKLKVLFLFFIFFASLYLGLQLYANKQIQTQTLENQQSKKANLTAHSESITKDASTDQKMQSNIGGNYTVQEWTIQTDAIREPDQKYQKVNQLPKIETSLQQINQTAPKAFKNYPNRAISSYVLKRRSNYQQIIAGFKKQDQNQLKSHLSVYKITAGQFYQSLVLTQHAPLDMAVASYPAQISKLTRLDEQQLNYYELKYGISSYNELQMCVIVPSYKNYKRFRYFFNLHTIAQQNYTNYRVVIIDDASNDDAVKNLEQELKYSQQLRQKVILVKNDKRQHHMANFYTNIHRYCRKGQILVTIDGDDELIGRYVFKVINAAYHRSKSLAIYSNHLQSKREVVFDIGISNDYPEQVKRSNSYRQQSHLYSHLRTTWVDLFLLIKESDLKSRQGEWFNNAVDNAMFYPIFEMSCGEVEYLSQILYKYNTFTGQNVDNLPYWARKQTNDEINAKARYTCLRDASPQTYDAIKAYLQCLLVFYKHYAYSAQQSSQGRTQSQHSFALESPLFNKAYSIASTSPSSEKMQIGKDSNSALELDSELVQRCWSYEHRGFCEKGRSCMEEHVAEVRGVTSGYFLDKFPELLGMRGRKGSFMQ